MAKPSPALLLGGLALVGLVGLAGVVAVAATSSRPGDQPRGGPVADRIASHHGIGLPLATAIVKAAHAVGTSPYWLAALIDLETAGKFTTGRHYPGHPTFTATGLIGFTEKTAGWLGTTTANLANMSARDQLLWVVTYLRRTAAGEHYDDPGVAVPLDSIQRLAWSVFYPPGRNWKPNRVVPDWITRDNPKVVIVSDYTNAVTRRLAA